MYRIKIKKKYALLSIGSLFLALLWAFFPFLGTTYTKTAYAEGENTPYGWEKLSAYTTYFNEKDGGRCENIAIAASLIDGVVLQAYGEFSFNATVGRRTEEAGFQQAKIIVNGEYVLGVGGGVCQVSTTLYNAALKSGLAVTEFHPHSLQVGYVSPSRDAMVSDHSDLKLFNPYVHSVYLQAQVGKNYVQITFFGKNEGDRYEITTEIIGAVPPPPPIVKEGDGEEVVRQEKEGIKSQSFLERYRGKTLLSKKRLRTDEYRPVQGIIVKKISLPTRKMPSNDCLLEEKLL